MTLSKGQKVNLQRIFRQKDYNRFAELIKDYNSTHVDPEFAATTRFKRTLAHGMHLYGVLCRMLSTQLPGPGMLQFKQDFVFPDGTFTDELVNFELEVVDVNQAEKTACIKTVVQTGHGTLGAEGYTWVFLPESNLDFPGLDENLCKPVESEGTEFMNIKLGAQAFHTRIFTEEDLEEYANVTGDQNPLFLNSAYAKKMGFKDRIIPGPLLSGMLSKLLGTDLPAKGTNWLKQKIHFPHPAYVGEEITATVKVVRIRPDKKIINLYDYCTTKEGKVVCQAESLVLMQKMLQN